MATIGLVRTTSSACSRMTVSQLGLMFPATRRRVGAGIFHLYTHAFFKACLFGSGAVIHAR
jgi:NADH-quinone oxidoreductase subunit L